MSTFVEATLLLLPADAGGRTAPVAPRDGSWRPLARHGPLVVRARLFEGPALLAPGDADRVMLEIESDAGSFEKGMELEVLEPGDRIVGRLTVMRVCAS